MEREKNTQNAQKGPETHPHMDTTTTQTVIISGKFVYVQRKENQFWEINTQKGHKSFDILSYWPQVQSQEQLAPFDS